MATSDQPSASCAAASASGQADCDWAAAGSQTERTNLGLTLSQLSAKRPTLVIFLRHAGCTFCREALHEIALRRRYLAQRVELVLVHLGTEEQAARFFPEYGLADVPRISDPGAGLYRAFGLERATWARLLAPKVWWRGLRSAIFSGHGLGPALGDKRQMPGVFLVYRGRIVRSFRHRTPADRPDYVGLAQCDECGAAPATATS